MSADIFIRRSQIPASAEQTFAWHAQPGAFERLQPPWERVRLLSDSGGIEDGARKEVLVRIGPFWRKWIAVHQNYVAGRQFQDVQTQGPFSSWTHTHTVTPDGPAQSLLEDRIEYALPLGAIGKLFTGRLIRRQLERMFKYRHQVTTSDLRAHQQTQGQPAMKVLISGPHGLIGAGLRSFLTTGGHTVVGLTRSKSNDQEIEWDPASGGLDVNQLRGFDAVVHLAGENIASGRWTDEVKRRIRDSRVQGTTLLCKTLAQLDSPPKVLVSASAIGYYGDRGDERLDESSSVGSNFLADVCQEWEAATQPARDKGIRVVNLRFGVVLSAAGGALAKMLLPFKMGVGGVVGSGKQYMSWIAVDDAIGAIHHALTHDELNGPVNGTAPSPVTNHEFTKTLGKVLHRPTIFPMPAFAARLAFGEMADALLLASTYVVPVKLQSSKYEFRFAELEGALRHVLGK